MIGRGTGAASSSEILAAQVSQQRASEYTSFDAVVGDRPEWQNPLNAAYLPMYHFRLFAPSDEDILDHADKPPHGGASGSALAQGIQGLPEVTIAESGITGLSFREVTVKSTAGGVSDTGNPKFVITLVDPPGVTLLDAFVAAADALNIRDWAKAPYFLELKFLGYDQYGEQVNPAVGMTNGGIWIWEVAIGNIEVKMSESGGVFTIHAVITGHSRSFWPLTRINAHQGKHRSFPAIN